MHQLVPLDRAEPVLAPAEDQRRHGDGAQALLLVWPVPQRDGLADERIRSEIQRHLKAERADLGPVRPFGEVVRHHLAPDHLGQLPGTGPGDLRRAPGLRTFTVLREDGARAARGEELSDGSPVMAILTTEGDAPGDWLRAGAALVRVLLRGRVDHVWASFFGQPLERPELRARLGEVIRAAGSTARWPQVALRLGHGGEVPPSPRRDVAAVLEQDDEELV